MKTPLPTGYITQGYKAKHRAYDIGWVSYTGKNTIELYAVDNGEVAVSGWFPETGAGYQVALYIPSGNPKYKYLVVYVHLEKCLVKKGDKVKRGQIIGYGDSSGNSTGPHLHFEVWKVPVSYVFTGYNFAKQRDQYAVEAKDLVNFEGINGNKIVNLEDYGEVLLSNTIARTKYSELNMRDYPSTVAFSVGQMNSDLKAVAKTTPVRGREWIKCEWRDRYVYIASEYVELISVEKPFKETFERNGLTVIVERK